MEIKSGDKLKDNDPRAGGERILTVIQDYNESVTAKTPAGRTVVIQKRRIYADGKPRKSGFDLMR